MESGSSAVLSTALDVQSGTDLEQQQALQPDVASDKVSTSDIACKTCVFRMTKKDGEQCIIRQMAQRADQGRREIFSILYSIKNKERALQAVKERISGAACVADSQKEFLCRQVSATLHRLKKPKQDTRPIVQIIGLRD